MKKIILYTRLSESDESEWNAWTKQTQCRDTEIIECLIIKGEIIECMINTIKIVINKGNKTLGLIPSYPDNDNNINQKIKRAAEFITELYKEIQDEIDFETVIAIHFGSSVTYNDRLKKWLEYFKNNGSGNIKCICSDILSKFSQGGVSEKPVLTDYSIAEDENTFARKNIENVVGFYQKLRKEIAFPEIEAKLELLQQCLTPQGAKDIISDKMSETLKNERYKFWKKNLKELNPTNFEKMNIINYRKQYIDFKDWTVEDVVKALSGERHSRKHLNFLCCFDAEYIIVLSLLRDSILTN